MRKISIILGKVKLGAKLVSSFMAVAVLCAIAGLLGIQGVEHGLERAASLNEARVIPLERLKKVSDMYAVNIVDASHKVRNRNVGWAAGLDGVKQARAALKEAWSLYEKRALEPDEARLAQELRPLMARADEAVVKLERLMADKNDYGLTEFTIKELYPAIDPVTEKVGALVDYSLAAARKDYETLRVNSERDRTVLWGTMLAAVGAAIAIGLLLKALISRPVQAAGNVVRAAAEGDLRSDLAVETSDEIGVMSSHLDTLLRNLRTSLTQITGSARDLSTAGDELNSISQLMASNSEETSVQANIVSSASEEVSRNVGVVVTGSDQMLASIKEISKNANESARVARNAVSVAETTWTTVARLGDSSQEIGKVVKLITSIAEQTNLLALNATIEAARAGESGKGFAVVANEVKELAKETAKATESIGAKIEAIQGDTRGAVDAIREIGGIINQINDYSATIASAVEEQTATTNEMSRNLTEASRGVDEIVRNISGVAQASRNVSQGAVDTQTAAGALSEMATSLRKMVEHYRV